MINVNGIVINEKDFYVGRFYKRKNTSYDSWCITNGKYFLGLTTDGAVERTTNYKSAFYTKNCTELNILFSMAKEYYENTDKYYLERMQVILDKKARYKLKNSVGKNKSKRKSFVKSKVIRQIVYDKNDGKCAICGRQLSLFGNGNNDDDYMTIDHIVPLDKNGKNEISNYQATCMVCNGLKANVMPEVFNNSFQSVLFQTIADDRHKQNQLLIYLCKLKMNRVMKQIATFATML